MSQSRTDQFIEAFNKNNLEQMHLLLTLDEKEMSSDEEDFENKNLIDINVKIGKIYILTILVLKMLRERPDNRLIYKDVIKKMIHHNNMDRRVLNTVYENFHKASIDQSYLKDLYPWLVEKIISLNNEYIWISDFEKYHDVFDLNKLYRLTIDKISSPKTERIFFVSFSRFSREQRKSLFLAACDNTAVKKIDISQDFFGDIIDFVLDKLSENTTLEKLRLDFNYGHYKKITDKIGKTTSIRELDMGTSFDDKSDPKDEKIEKINLSYIIKGFTNIQDLEVRGMWSWNDDYHNVHDILKQIIIGLEDNDCLTYFPYRQYYIKKIIDEKLIHIIDKMLNYNRAMHKSALYQGQKLQRFAGPIITIAAYRAIQDQPERLLPVPKVMQSLFNAMINPYLGKLEEINDAKEIQKSIVGPAAVIKLIHDNFPEEIRHEFKMEANQDESGDKFIEIHSKKVYLQFLQRILDGINKVGDASYLAIDGERAILRCFKELFATIHVYNELYEANRFKQRMDYGLSMMKIYHPNLFNLDKDWHYLWKSKAILFCADTRKKHLIWFSEKMYDQERSNTNASYRKYTFI